jgi:hypothetical protein
MAVAKKFGSDEKEFGSVEGFTGPDEPFVTAMRGHVVGGKKDDIVVGCIQMTIGAIDNMCFGQDDAGFGFELMNDEFVDLCRVGAGLRPGDGGEREEKGK